MVLEYNKGFADHYSAYRCNEEASKTKKVLKKQIKELEESSSSSDSEYEECYKNKYVEQCDKILKMIREKNEIIKDTTCPLYEEIIVDVSKDKTDKAPIYANDLKRTTVLRNEMEIEEEEDFNEISNLDSEDLLNLQKSKGNLYQFDNNLGEGKSFIKKSQNPQVKFEVKPNTDNAMETDESSHDGSDDDKIESDKEEKPDINFNRDRRAETVRVVKNKSRVEKRKERKEKKEKELKEKMKRLNELNNKHLYATLEKIKQSYPMAKDLTVEDLDGDFDINEYLNKMSSFYEQEDSNLPVDNEKPVFSDNSDIELDKFMNDEYSNDEEQIKVVKKKNKKESEKKNENEEVPNKKITSYFTNLDITEEQQSKKKEGIMQKSTEPFNRDIHGNYNNYLKKSFKFYCEQLISGNGDNDDIQCRFKYRRCEAQDYGLNTEEILLADPKELNQIIPLKKVVRLTTAAEEDRIKNKFSSDRMQQRKKTILRSVYDVKSDKEEDVTEEEEEKEETNAQEKVSKATKKRLRKLAKKKQMKEMISQIDDNQIEESVTNKKRKFQDIDEDNEETKPKKSKKDKIQHENLEEVITEKIDENPIKKKSKKNKIAVDNAQEIIAANIDEKVIKKKSKKNKTQVDNVESIEEKANKVQADNVEEITDETTTKKKSKKTKVPVNIVEDVIEENIDEKTLKKHSKNKNCDKGKIKKNKKSNSTAVCSGNRLQALGIKPGFYKYVLANKNN